MLEFIQSKEIWEKAIQSFKESTGKEPVKSEDYKAVSTLYYKLGGKFSNKAYELIENYI